MESVPTNVPEYNVVIKANKIPTGEHCGRYNDRFTSEVAVVNAGQQIDERDIVLRSRDENLHKISELLRTYDSLQYPLMFCRVEDGYSIDIPQINPVTREPVQKKFSYMNCYFYHNCKPLLRYSKLLNPYVVDQYAKI